MNKTINQDNLSASLRFLDKQGEAVLEQLKTTDPAKAEQMEKLGTLLSSEGFCKQFAADTDKQARVKLFADNGINLTGEEVEGLSAQIADLAQKLMDNDGTLGEEDLERISGGISTAAAVGGVSVSTIVFGAIGTVIFPGIGSLIGAALGFGIGMALVSDG